MPGKDSVECSEFHEEVTLLQKYLLVLLGQKHMFVVVSFFEGKTAQYKNTAFQQCPEKHTAIKHIH